MYIKKNAGQVYSNDFGDTMKITKDVLDNLSGADGSLAIGLALCNSPPRTDQIIPIMDIVKMDGQDDFTFEFEGEKSIQPRLRLRIDVYDLLRKLGATGMPENEEE